MVHLQLVTGSFICCEPKGVTLSAWISKELRWDTSFQTSRIIQYLHTFCWRLYQILRWTELGLSYGSCLKRQMLCILPIRITRPGATLGHWQYMELELELRAPILQKLTTYVLTSWNDIFQPLKCIYNSWWSDHSRPLIWPSSMTNTHRSTLYPSQSRVVSTSWL